MTIKNISAHPNPEALQVEQQPPQPISKGENDHSPTKDHTNDSNLSHQSSNESATATDDKSTSANFHDLGSTILLSDVSVVKLPHFHSVPNLMTKPPVTNFTRPA